MCTGPYSWLREILGEDLFATAQMFTVREAVTWTLGVHS